MPVAIPVVAGAIAGYASAAAGLAFVGGYVFATAVVVGAIAGAVVGGIQAAVTGGDILEGVLFGAVGGAVGGAIGGYFGASSFIADKGIVGADALTVQNTGYSAIGTGAEGGGGAAGMIGGGGGKEAAGSFLGSDGKYLLASGAMGLMKKDPELPYEATEQGFKEKLEAQKEIAKINSESGGSGAAEAAAIAAAQREKEALLNAQLTRERIAADEKELNLSLAQRQRELEKPFDEQRLARNRQRETATGLTLIRKQQEASQVPTEDIQDPEQTPVYVS